MIDGPCGADLWRPPLALNRFSECLIGKEASDIELGNSPEIKESWIVRRE